MEYQYKKQLSTKRCFQFVCVIFFLNRIISTNIFGDNSVLNSVYVSISKLLSLYYVIKYFYFYTQKRGILIRDFKCILAVVLYFFVILISTFNNDGNVRRILMTAYPIIGTICFIDIESRHYGREIVLAFFLFFNVILCWNFADMVLVRKVLKTGATELLIGGRNQLAIFLSICFASTLAYIELNSLKKRYTQKYVFIKLIILMSAIFSGSATSIFGILAIYILYIFNFTTAKSKILKPAIIALAYSVFWFSLIVFRMQYLASDLIVNTLHKDLTLSHRTIIWDKALEMISDKPILGYGMSDSVNIFTVNHDYTGNNNNVWTTLSGHNQILQILYYGGIVLLLAFVFLYFVSCASERRKNHLFYIYFLSVIAVLIVWMTEVPSEYAMFTMLGMCFYSERFEGKKYNIS